MGVMDPGFAPDAQFTRPNHDADGNPRTTPLGSNQVVVSEKTRQVFIPKGLDRKAGDQFEFAGGQFTLAGRARGDQLQPFTGDDLGWVAFDVEFGWMDGASAASASRGVLNSGGGRK